MQGVIGRDMMEGAWIKVLVGLFEEMRGKRDVMRGYVGKRVNVGGVRGEELKGRILMTIKEVEGEMKEILRIAVEQRFAKEVEEYWIRKWEIHKDRYPNLDIKCTTDWSVEAPFQKSLLKPGDVNEDDYEEDEDETEEEIIEDDGEDD
ncbi:0d9b0beb-88d4-45d7-9924-22bd3aa9c1ca [Sclerotinia trifoliorum]|uniref:0d9b0beb-88d4-45d7-9924-22bd3aa9c1ca n=1 Tax=Sclerotinia trifoliorum TaxID=28548 RepID=A0A8H2VLX8_9HELO|nr:0d9b0beb-88d4-45d7-9924-22bd3aa9c1ca [Sclerotinia trifoliorum]